jgi:RNA polymerase sigma-70 factor (ECF subfamily)
MENLNLNTISHCDIAAIERARDGDEHAFASLYREHSRRVLSLCRRMTRDASAAEDCMQEAFFNAWRALHRYETRAAFTSWLHRIAVNVVLAKRRKRSLLTDVQMEPGQLEKIEWSVDTPVEEREIENAVNALPEGARKVLMLSASGYSHPEAAQMLGLAEGTCKAQLHRARRLLRARLIAA